MEQRHQMPIELRFNKGSFVDAAPNDMSAEAMKTSEANGRHDHRVRVIDDGDDGDTIYIGLGSKPLHIVIRRRGESEQSDEGAVRCEHQVDWKSVGGAGRYPYELGASCTKCGENGFAAVAGGLFSWNDEDP